MSSHARHCSVLDHQSSDPNANSRYQNLRFAEGSGHWSMTTLREKFMKIGAKVASHGRYVTIQLAEVAVPRELF